MNIGDTVWFTMERYERALARQQKSPYGMGTVTDEYVIANFVFGQKIKRMTDYGGVIHVDLEHAGAMAFNIKSLGRTASMKTPKKEHLPEELFEI